MRKSVVRPAATAPPPTQVKSLKATSFLYAAVNLTWAALPRATAYQTQYQKKGVVSWVNGPRVTVTSTTVTGLDAGGTYNFRVYGIGA